MRVPLLAVLVALVPFTAGALELEFDKFVSDSGETFTFTTVFGEPLPAPPAIGKDAQPGASASYQVWVDPDKVETTRFGFFRYTVYARAKADPTKFIQFTVQGQPAGAFDDQFARVRFHIGETAPFEEGFVDVPIFGTLAPDALTAELKDQEPVEVQLASDKDIAVTLKNALGAMPLSIVEASAAPGDRDLWGTIEVRRGSKPLTAFNVPRGATMPGALVLHVEPRTASAFATALIRGRKQEDDVINIVITYKTPAREENTYSLPVRIRFVPWPPALLPVTLAGVVLGWLVPLTVKGKRQDWGDRLRVLGAAAAMAILVEIVGMLLVAHGDSSLRILGFQVDPFQMLPAALIGFLAGLTGLQSRSFLRRLSKTPFWKWGKSEPEHA